MKNLYLSPKMELAWEYFTSTNNLDYVKLHTLLLDGIKDKYSFSEEDAKAILQYVSHINKDGSFYVNFKAMNSIDDLCKMIKSLRCVKLA